MLTITGMSDLEDLVADTQWMEAGVCSQVDPELFFPAKGDPTRPAKSICAGCPIRQRCLDYALDNEIQWGIWGGMTLRERRRYAARRRACNLAA
jgi:WhiB family redox-sensing transcriptional regulator